jgi:preprotein translocase subunit SecG
MFIIFSVFYILIAAAMIVLILMQRGQGADAGAGFGAGASGTVFGARGSASFMTRATGVLATLFFLISLGMAIYFSHHGGPKKSKDLGVMSAMQTPAASTAATPAAAAPASAKTASAAPKAVSGTDVPTLPQAAAGASSGKPAIPVPAKK